MNTNKTLEIYGAGLAGCEAAHQASRLGVPVRLYEMKPKKMTPAHTKSDFAELVCSNSLRSDCVSNAVGLLKEEMRLFSSLIIEAADATRVPAGSALAVDRDGFSSYITEKIKNDPLIEVVEEEITEIPKGKTVIIATGPLTSEPLSDRIAELFGKEGLHFFDAAAPIVDFSTVDLNKAWFASRYDKGDADYLNCPMTREEYTAFYEALTTAREAKLHDFDRDLTVFEGCMPVEIMAKRGYETLLFGPLKPVGLPDPKTGEEPYAVVQLRRDNKDGTAYNIVGFQTHLAIDEQKRVFRMIPGLENAEFLRYGVMHRNTYLNSPEILNESYMVRNIEGLYFAGQMTGVEGYVESAASGMIAGISAALSLLGKENISLSRRTALGALGNYVKNGSTGDFQPSNINFGIIEPLDHRVKGGKRAKNEAIAERALNEAKEAAEGLNAIIAEQNI